MGEVPGDAHDPAGPRTETELEAEGATWIVRVGGMSRSGAVSASAPILLLRFERKGGDGEAPREAWVVGRSLAGLTDLQVDAAFRSSAAAPGAWTRKPLFPEASSRSGKDG